MDTINEKIMNFYKQPNQLTNILRILRVIIDFVVSSRSQIDMKIFDYASEVLKMKIHTEKNDICKEIYEMETNCLRSLWISLSMHRSILLTQYGQDPFDRLNEKYKKQIHLIDIQVEKMVIDEENNDDDEDDDDNSSGKSSISEDVDKSLIKVLMKNKEFLNMKHIKLLINILYNIIWFKLSTSIKVNRNEIFDNSSRTNNEDNEDEYELTMKLKDIILEIGTNESELVRDNDIKINEVINEFNLDKLQLQNVYHVWILFIKAYFPA
jgi:hypothetical protein